MLLLIIRYILMLPIVRHILLICGLSGLLNVHEGPMGPTDQHQSVFICIPNFCIPIPSHLNLNNLDFSGYNNIQSEVAHFKTHFANFGDFDLWKANERPLGTPNQYILLCMCIPNGYSSIPCQIGLNNLDFSGYNKI